MKFTPQQLEGNQCERNEQLATMAVATCCQAGRCLSRRAAARNFAIQLRCSIRGGRVRQGGCKHSASHGFLGLAIAAARPRPSHLATRTRSAAVGITRSRGVAATAANCHAVAILHGLRRNPGIAFTAVADLIGSWVMGETVSFVRALRELGSARMGLISRQLHFRSSRRI